MRFALKFSGNIYNLMRQAGYHPVTTEHEKEGESSFARRIGASDYPHFHIYLREVASGTAEINIHLDQKKPIYRGSVAHSGEYEGEIVEKEVERIKKFAI